jgi:hypothetical protein
MKTILIFTYALANTCFWDEKLFGNELKKFRIIHSRITLIEEHFRSRTINCIIILFACFNAPPLYYYMKESTSFYLFFFQYVMNRVWYNLFK